MALNKHEIAQNDNEIIMLALLSAHGKSAALQEQMTQFLKKYTEEKEITLMNLLENERERLIKILNEAVEEKSQDVRNAKLQASLAVWEQTLQNAIPRKGRLVDLYKKVGSSGMASDLQTLGYVPSGKWGTDLDVRQCLGKDMTDPRKIQAKGVYILPPVSLTESDTAIQDQISEALKAVQALKMNDTVSLRIPANCGDSHWRLAIVEIKNAAIESATLWDSLGGAVASLKTTKAYENLNSAVTKVAGKEVKVDAVPTGKQTNGHSCMDYTLQEAYAGTDKVNEIIAAKNSDQLRVAVVKQIALNNPSLGAEVAKNIVFEANTRVVKSSVAVKQTVSPVTPEASQKITQSLQASAHKQILFDEIFASRLQDIYNKNPNADEKESQKTAYEQTVKETNEIGLFEDVSGKKLSI